MTSINDDFYGWVNEAANQVKAIMDKDPYCDDIVEILHEMANREEKEIKSALRVLLHHMLKWKYQPTHQTASWKTSMLNAMYSIEDTLTPALWNSVKDSLDKSYTQARVLAHTETKLPLKTFPTTSEWSIVGDIIKWKNPKKPGKDLDWSFVEGFIEKHRK